MSRYDLSAFRRIAVVLVTTLVTLVGCSSSSQTDPDPTPQSEVYFKATVNGQSWSCSAETSVASGSPITTTLTGTLGTSQDASFHTMIISVPARNFALGRYRIDSLSSDTSGAVQYVENNIYGLTAAKQDDGYLEITSVSATHIEGTFAFVLIGTNMTNGEVVRRTFTGGTFRLPRLN